MKHYDLEVLSETAKNLNASREEISAEIQKLDAFLKSINAGIEMQVPAGSCTLGYQRLKNADGRWGLCITKDNPPPQAGGRTTWPFCEAPTLLRAEAIYFIPTLLDAIHAEALERVQQMQAATVYVRELAIPAPVKDVLSARCTYCRGTGAERPGDPATLKCEECNGTGKKRKSTSKAVTPCRYYDSGTNLKACAKIADCVLEGGHTGPCMTPEDYTKA